jgi:hypothetical protein
LALYFHTNSSCHQVSKCVVAIPFYRC